MKRLLILLPFLACTLLAWTQTDGGRSPSIQVKNLHQGEVPVRISDVKIDVKVVGSLAVTTVDLTFSNPNNRVLEGELQFPLADGQSISRFALDLNGKLREGVVVEKAKGQAVFESTIRQKIDPALLEKTTGNNFRTRVYPLPAKGSRRVVIAYEQELVRSKGQYQFFLPIEYSDKLDNFALNLQAFGNQQAPQVDKMPWGEFAFDRQGDAYVANYASKNYTARGQLVFSVPVKDEVRTYIEQGKVSERMVFYSRLFPNLKTVAKEQSRKIALFWDVSGSMTKRDAKLENELLDNYFSQLRNVTVQLYPFNCLLSKPQIIQVTNGNWSALQSALVNLRYDGATQFGMLDFSKVDADEILVFTDGLNSFGKQLPTMGKTRVSVVNSSLSADHSMARYIASETGGAYINLKQQAPKVSVDMLMNENLRLISVDYNKQEVSDLVTSNAILNLESGFSMAGKLHTPSAVVELSFGVGKNVLHTEKIVLHAKKQIANTGIVERIWAAKMIDNLDMLYEKNQQEIEKIGREYNIVTRNTSLIVLDDVRDYVRHKITPPEELMEEYNSIVRGLAKEQEENFEERMEDVMDMLKDRQDWWKTDFPIKPPKVKKVKPAKPQPQRPSVSSASGSSYVGYQSTDNNVSTVSGNVIDAYEGLELIGVAVSVKGERKERVTLTDLDGKYSIRAQKGETLVFEYLGMLPLEVVVKGSTLNVVMAAQEQALNEMVVTAMGYAPQRKMLTGSVSVVSADVISASPARNEDVQHNEAIDEYVEERREEQIMIRGVSSGVSVAPIYVVDGQVVDNVDGIDAEDIESMSVLKDPASTAIYGSRGASGVVVIQTKNNAGASATNSAKSEDIQLANWKANAPYMIKLLPRPKAEMYETYLSLRDEYQDAPSFYLDVANLFVERGLKEEAFIILSNLAEMKIEDYRLLRVLAHRLQQLGYTEYAIDQFKMALRLRPEEPQSYRDLGLAYVENGDYQAAIDMLYKIIETDWDGRFDEIELFAIEEINNAIYKAKRSKIKLDLSKIDERLLVDMPVDMRIVLSWDTDNSDMDLHVIDPDGEECYYAHRRTKLGGIISDDFTDGYGPEEFIIKKAKPGTYQIKAKYYGTREQTLVGPTTIYLDIYKYYSSQKETKKTITMRLSSNKEMLDIGKVTF